MDKIDSTQLYDSWNVFEQASYFLGPTDEYYRLLSAAFDLGWQVEEPVYFRPRWDEGSAWVFHFILKKETMGQSCLITIRQSPDIERLISQEGWQVDQYPIKGNSYAYYRSE